MPEAAVQRIKILSEIKDPFGRIPNIIIDLYGPGMGQAGWLYTLLTRFKNNDSSETFVSMKTLALTGGITEKTIKSWAEHLATLGVIKIIKDLTYMQEKRRSAPNTYVLLLPPLPPPPELVEKFYPLNWTPPERALKAIINISNLMTLESRPQETVEPEGVGEKIAPTPPSTASNNPEVGEKSSPSRGSDLPHKGQILTPNKPYITRHTEKETTTRPPAPPSAEQVTSAVVEAFLNLSFETFKQKDPTLSTTEMEEFYHKCLNILNDDEEKAKEYLSEKIKVVLQLKKTADPKAVLWKAIAGNWKPRNEPTRTFREDEFNFVKKLKEDNEKIDRENEEARKLRMTLPIEEIIKVYNTYPGLLGFERNLRILKSFFEGNPNIDAAIEMIKKGG